MAAHGCWVQCGQSSDYKCSWLWSYYDNILHYTLCVMYMHEHSAEAPR